MVAMVATLGVLGCEPPCEPWKPSVSIDSRVSVDLHAVTAAAELGYFAIAVGSKGTVVAVGTDSKSSVVADVDLRGVTDRGNGRWVVVGDDGFVAASADYGETWTTLDLQTSANLHAIVTVRESVILAGDEVVRVLLDDTWVEPPTPEGGWGQLRGLGSSYPIPGEDPTIFAVGLDGVIWSTEDPSGVWVAEDSGVDRDLFAVGPLWYHHIVAVGANGTFLLREGAEWRPVETNRTVDFIDYQGIATSGLLLTADGEVLQYSAGFEHVERIEGARDLVDRQIVFDGLITGIAPGFIAVGDAGLAVIKTYPRCEG